MLSNGQNSIMLSKGRIILHLNVSMERALRLQSKVLLHLNHIEGALASSRKGVFITSLQRARDRCFVFAALQLESSETEGFFFSLLIRLAVLTHQQELTAEDEQDIRLTFQ